MSSYFASLNNSNLFILFVTITAIFVFASATGTHPRRPPFNKIYAFGDSFTDTGNTKSISGPSGFGHVSNSPYGSTFFHHSTNRYSDGRLVIDFVAETLSLPYLPPYRNLKGNDASSGVNFAVAGSTAIDHAFFVENNLTLDTTPESIQTQLLWFRSFLKSRGYCKLGAASEDCRAAFDDALVWVGEIGANDYAYTVGSNVSSDTIRELAITSFTEFLQSLLKMGAKYIVVQGLPLTGCLPLSLTLFPEGDRDDIGCVKRVNNHSNTHNAVLQAKLQGLRTQFPQAVIAFADYWNAYRTVMKNPSNFGLTEKFKACCGTGTGPYNFDVFNTCGTPSATVCKNPSQYINWDGVHLTEAMYKVVSSMFLHGTFSHPPFSFLLDR